MDMHQNIPLANYLTMRIGGPAKFMVDVHSKEELLHALSYANTNTMPFYILGSGSNVIATDEGFSGVVIRNRIPGFSVIHEDESSVSIKVGAGENWDETVAKTVDMNLTGIEALSGIPGTVGASPVQNVGAYGQEVADTLIELDAYDTQTQSYTVLKSDVCGFSYRHSIFRGEMVGRYVILSVSFRLYKSAPQPPFYAAIQSYLDSNNITFYTPSEIRNAVLAIRADKLPDPLQKPNSGSFFKNAIIEDWQLTDLLRTHPTIPHYDMGDGTYKIPTGWLIEQAHLKGALLHGMRVHDKNTLVLINESATTYRDLASARNEIAGAVRDIFRINIVQEPLEIRQIAPGIAQIQ